MLCMPEFQQVIMLMSSPLAQLAALWGMTRTAALQLKRSPSFIPRFFRSSMQDAALSLSPVQP
jgi:hypothetical protein